jgi:hypothetical protein
MDWDIVYPVILLREDGVWMARDSEQLTTTEKSLLKAGLYNDRSMIDSAGRSRHLKEVREPTAVGLLRCLRGVWNPNALIKVELVFDTEITSLSIDELKERLLKSLAGLPRNLTQWNAGTINFEQLKEGVKTSKTFEEVFRVMREYTTIAPELL